MPTVKEKTQQLILDTLDEEAVIIFGLTSAEIGMIFGFFIFVSILSFVFLFGLMGLKMYALKALPIGLGVGIVISFIVGRKVGRLKQGRPSYLLLGDLSRNVQLKGLSIFGLFKLKIKSGFYNSQSWDNQSHKEITSDKVKVLFRGKDE